MIVIFSYSHFMNNSFNTNLAGTIFIVFSIIWIYSIIDIFQNNLSFSNGINIVFSFIILISCIKTISSK